MTLGEVCRAIEECAAAGSLMGLKGWWSGRGVNIRRVVAELENARLSG